MMNYAVSEDSKAVTTVTLLFLVRIAISQYPRQCTRLGPIALGQLALPMRSASHPRRSTCTVTLSSPRPQLTVRQIVMSTFSFNTGSWLTSEMR